MHKSYCSGFIRLPIIIIILLICIMLAPIAHLDSAETVSLGRSFAATTESHGPKSVPGTASAHREPARDLRADRISRAPIRDARKTFARQPARSKTTSRTTQLTMDLWAPSHAHNSPSPPGPWRTAPRSSRTTRARNTRDDPRGRPVMGPSGQPTIRSTRTNARLTRAAR